MLSERFGIKLGMECVWASGWTTIWQTGQLCGETACDVHFPDTRGENSAPHIQVTEGSKAHHLPFKYFTIPSYSVTHSTWIYTEIEVTFSRICRLCYRCVICTTCGVWLPYALNFCFETSQLLCEIYVLLYYSKTNVKLILNGTNLEF
jgi:hypothetical protein